MGLGGREKEGGGGGGGELDLRPGNSSTKLPWLLLLLLFFEAVPEKIRTSLHHEHAALKLILRICVLHVWLIDSLPPCVG